MADLARSEDDISIHAPKGADVVSILLMLFRHKRVIFGAPLAAAFVSTIVALVLPNWYTASTKLLPPQQHQSSAYAFLGQLGMSSGLGASAGQALGLRNPSEVYVAMLKSHVVADKLIERFKLADVYMETSQTKTREQLWRNSNFSASREGIISVLVDDKSPTRARDIANAYIEELTYLSARFAVSEAGQRRLFFEGQLAKIRDDLGAAEVALKTFAEETKMVNPTGQISLSVSAEAALTAQITAREVVLSAMRTYATEANPEIQRILQEISGMRAEITKLRRTGADLVKSDGPASLGKAPEIQLEFARRLRELKHQESLYGLIAKQYEIARIDEAKGPILIQVLEPAIAPEFKSKPRRAAIVSISVLTFFILGCLAAFAAEVVRGLRLDPRIKSIKSS